MTYEEAKAIKLGQQVLISSRNYVPTTVLKITAISERKALSFLCTDGIFSHKDLEPMMSVEELIKLYIGLKSTRVFIRHNNDTGEWLYSVEVVNSAGFWLNSFETQKEALDYISKNNLKMSIE